MRLPALPSEQAACTVDVIEWLHQVWVLNETGEQVQPDPFYERNDLLTPKMVSDVLTAIETIFHNEIVKFPGYHRNAQGFSADEILATPGYDKMAYEQQLAVVQGIDRICKRYEPPETPAVVEGPTPAPDYLADY